MMYKEKPLFVLTFEALAQSVMNTCFLSEDVPYEQNTVDAFFELLTATM